MIENLVKNQEKEDKENPRIIIEYPFMENAQSAIDDLKKMREDYTPQQLR